MMNYVKENEKDPCTIFRNNTLYFLDTGQIEFKGVQMPSCEALFKEEDMYKLKFSEEMVQLFKSINDNLWETRIFQDLMALVSKAAYFTPQFSYIPPNPIHGMQTITNESITQICKQAGKAYITDEDYATAVDKLKILISVLQEVPKFERLILDYLRGITEKYDMLLEDYLKTIDSELENHVQDIFQGNYLKAWQTAKNAVVVYDKLRAMGRKSDWIPKKKALWLSLMKQNPQQMEFVLHSGKK
jgi:hypothetical protein